MKILMSAVMFQPGTNVSDPRANIHQYTYYIMQSMYVLLKLNPLNNVNNPLACFSPSHPVWDTAQRSKVWDIV